MKHNKTVKSYRKLSFLLALGLGCSSAAAGVEMTLPAVSVLRNSPDSIGNETINGQRYVIHKLTPKETYYQLSRIYSVSVTDIMNANNKKNLRVGDTVKIPRGPVTQAVQPAVLPTTTQAKPDSSKVLINPADITEYKVSKNETLYAISQRFRISVEDIKKVNGITDAPLRENQMLKIPNHSLPKPDPAPAVTPQIPVEPPEQQTIDDSMFKPNRYGIREKKERGIGVWIDNLTSEDQTSLALHKSAPVGTILKITNPMNQSVTFAKVVGKFGENQDTHDAIVVLSKTVASSIGALDRRFQVEITYGLPLLP